MGGYGLLTERVHYRATLYNNYETEKKLQHFIGSSEYLNMEIVVRRAYHAMLKRTMN